MEEGGQAISAVMSICNRAMEEARQMLQAIPKQSTPAPSSSNTTTSVLDLTKGLVFYSEDKKYKLVAYKRRDSRSSMSVQSRKGEKMSSQSSKSQEDRSVQSRKSQNTTVADRDTKSHQKVVPVQSRKELGQQTTVAVQSRKSQEDRSARLMKGQKIMAADRERKSQLKVVPVQPRKTQEDRSDQSRKGQRTMVGTQSRKGQGQKTTEAAQPRKSREDRSDKSSKGQVHSKKSQVNTAQDWKRQDDKSSKGQTTTVQPRKSQAEVFIRTPVSVKERESQLTPVQMKKSHWMVADWNGQSTQSNKSQEDKPRKELKLSVQSKKSQVNTTKDCKGEEDRSVQSVKRTCTTGWRKMRHEEVFENKSQSYTLVLEAQLGRDGKLKQIDINGTRVNI